MPKPHDTEIQFILSGATEWEWYNDTVYLNAETDDWSWSFDEYGDDGSTGNTYTVTHKSLMLAISRIARDRDLVRSDIRRECLLFLRDPEDSDFDADSADVVIQIATFGEVRYG